MVQASTKRSHWEKESKTSNQKAISRTILEEESHLSPDVSTTSAWRQLISIGHPTAKVHITFSTNPTANDHAINLAMDPPHLEWPLHSPKMQQDQYNSSVTFHDDMVQNCCVLHLLWSEIPWKCILFPITLPAHCFLWIWNKLVDTVAWPFIKKKPPDSPEHAFVNSRRKGKSHMVFATVFNLDDKIKDLSEKSVYFDTDTAFVICDNSANTHICNDKHIFSDLREILTPSTVATIGGRNSCPSGIGHGHGKMIMATLTITSSKMSTISLSHQSTSSVLLLLLSISMMKKELVSTPRHLILACIGTTTSLVVHLCTQIQTYLKCPSMAVILPLPGSWTSSNINAMTRLITSAASHLLISKSLRVCSESRLTVQIHFRKLTSRTHFLNWWSILMSSWFTRSKAKIH